MKKKILILLALAAGLPAFPLQAAEIYLTNGDRISGEPIEFKETVVIVNTEAMGLVDVSRASIRDIAGAEVPPDFLPEKKEKLWDGKITVSFNRTRGNTETSELQGGFLIHRKVEKKNEFHLKADGYYSSRDRKMNAQRYDAMTRYAYSFGKKKKWYNFYKAEVNRDRFANIDVRLIPSTGVGYWFSDSPKWKLFTELGAGVEITDFRRGDEKRDTELVLIPRAYAERVILKELKASQEVTVYPSLTDRGEYRLILDSSLINPISNFLALKINWLNEYNSDPGGDAKEHDMRLTTGLEYSF